MSKPTGSLTASQHEILEVLWDGPADGMSVAEVWEEITTERDIARTTILNLMTRLEKRGWLMRERDGSAMRYRPALDRDASERRLADGYLKDFFDQRSVQAFSSLLGSERFDEQELEAVRKLVDRALREKKKQKNPKNKRTS